MDFFFFFILPPDHGRVHERMFQGKKIHLKKYTIKSGEQTFQKAFRYYFLFRWMMKMKSAHFVISLQKITSPSSKNPMFC